MSINRTCLHAFHIVATEGSFSHAAIAHHVSQPTLSAQVRELETRYQVSLFERRGHGVVLTEMGKSLFDITAPLFELEHKAQLTLQSTSSVIAGTLRIGADSPYLIIPLMKQFQLDYPKVKLRVNFGNSRELLKSLKNRKYDLILLPDIKASTQLSVKKILSDQLIAFVNLTHPWAKKNSIRLGQIIEESIVLREKGSNTRARFETILKARGLQLNRENISVISSREGVREAVAAGFGAGIVAKSEFGHDIRLHPLPLADVKNRHSENLVCLKNRSQDDLIRRFLKLKPVSPRV